MKFFDASNFPSKAIVRTTANTGSTITLDASKGKIFVINVNDSFTLANPINMKDGEQITVIFRILAASKVLTPGSKIKGSITLTTTAARTDCITLIYDKTNDIYIVNNVRQAIVH